VAILARRLIVDFPEDYHYFSTPSFDFHGMIIRNHDYLLKSYPGADGMKTGYTNAAGHNLVTSAVRDGVRLIGVVMAAPSNLTRDRDMTAMLNDGFAQEFGGGSALALADAAAAARQAQAHPQAPVIPATDPAALHAREAAAGATGGIANWNLDLGTYQEKSAAYLALRIARRKADGGVAHLAMIHTKARRVLWHAYVTNVSEDRARSTCTAMNHYGRTCYPMTPGAFRNGREMAQR
jgi:D-alanyl-D-alanine carboxypeptidase